MTWLTWIALTASHLLFFEIGRRFGIIQTHKIVERALSQIEAMNKRLDKREKDLEHLKELLEDGERHYDEPHET